jgi:hypothetical protein
LKEDNAMPNDEKVAKGQTGSVAPTPEQRSFDADPAKGGDSGLEIDTFSRNDAEGATARGGEPGGDGDVEAEVAKSPDDRYETDAFSRNDAQGGTALGEDATKP